MWAQVTQVAAGITLAYVRGHAYSLLTTVSSGNGAPRLTGRNGVQNNSLSVSLLKGKDKGKKKT